MPEPVVVPSVPDESATPSEPAAEVTPETPSTPVAETLYDLPDGRKVNAETLQKEWKENFLPDYTRKSQKLAELDGGAKKIEDKDVPEWKRPDYVPKSYAEIVELAEKNALERFEQRQMEKENQSKQIAEMVDAQIAEIKKVDPALDENQLFQHASKFGIRDLKIAHQNLQAIKQAALDAEQRTLKNLKARGADPVVGQPGAVVGDTAIDPNISSKYGSALDYFRSINGK